MILINLTSGFFQRNFTSSMSRIAHAMKIKRLIFLTSFGLFLLFALSFHSCELVGCYSCTRTDYQTGKTEKTSTCDDDKAEQLRSSGWSCKGGW